jgi:concanavalin A-like lectin/glucanase superfamily protein
MGGGRLRHGGAAVFVFVASGVSLAATPDLVAAYGFEENAGPVTADASGNGLTAVLVGATWTTQGKYGNALDFDGTTSWVTVVHDAPALKLTTAMTLEAWVKRTAAASQWTDVVYKGNDNYFLASSTSTGGRPAAGGIFGTTNATVVGPAALPVGTWVHLATTYNGSNLRLYVNGSQVASINRTGALATSGFPLQIGGDSFYGQRFTGTIDEVRIYKRALTQAEIQADMAAPLVVPASDTTPPSAPETLASLAFSGTTIKLSWGAASDDVGVVRYRLERCRGAACTDFEEVASPEGTAYTDTGLALSTTYSYRVSALDAAGHAGPPSSVVAARTLATASIPGLVAAYGFETGSGGSVTDASGNGNDGTIAGAAWTTGRHGNALSFNGVNSKVNIPDAPSLRLTTALTLSAWVKLASFPSTTHWVDVLYKGLDNYYILATSDINRQPELGGVLGSGKHILFGVRRLSVGTWTHLALTYDGAALRVYVDGQLVSSSPQTGAFITSTRPLQIGGDDDFGQHLAGTIDEVRLYNRPLTAEEIQADLASPIEGVTHPTPATNTVTPSTIAAGSSATVLEVSGTGFTADSVVLWDDAPRATAFVSPTLLRATILELDLAETRAVPITVFNAPPIGGTSNAQTVAICPGSVWYRDADGDERGDGASPQVSCGPIPGFVSGAGDCHDDDASAWAIPGEAGELTWLPDRETLTWSPPSELGGTSVRYDTIRSGAADGFELDGSCLESEGEDTTSVDAATPSDGLASFYLVRARNGCGGGSAGRPAAACP